jgi:hypothetical protein
LFLFRGNSSRDSSSRGSFLEDLFSGEFCIKSLDGSIFVTCFVGKASLKVPILFPYTFFFRRILTFVPIGLPRFKHALNSFDVVLIDCLTWTSIFAGVLASGM